MDTVKIDSKGVKIIAHRGLSGIERENTCPAFVAAGNRSYFGIEADVHITRDGKFVIIHDETTTRVTLGKYNINVEESDYSKLEKIILPDLDGTCERKDIYIPLLKEYIKVCQKYEKFCVLEIKNHFKEEDIVSLTQEISDAGYTDSVIFISFDYENCINLRKFLPQNSIEYLWGGEVTNGLIKKLLSYNLDLDISYKRLTGEDVNLLHSNGIKVNCWTCDNPVYAQKLISYGVDFMTTNILE